MTTNPKNSLDIGDFRLKLDHQLSLIFEQLGKSDSKLSMVLRQFVLRGGKRYRSWLIYLGYNFEKHLELSTEFYKLCGAIELIHGYLLIHDDIMDKSILRRGQPTVHQELARQNDKDYGISMAILAGDLAQAFAFEVIGQLKFDSKLLVKSIGIISSTLISTIYGQEQDIDFVDTQVGEEDVIEMYKLKTARYSFEMPLKIGLTLSGVDFNAGVLKRFSENVGIAFQIRDDILGLIGSSQETGKALGEDIRLGKRTLLTVAMASRLSEEETKVLKSLMGNENITESDVEKVKSLATNCGAVSYVNDLADQYLELALADIDKIANLNEEIGIKLRTLVKSINRRKK